MTNITLTILKQPTAEQIADIFKLFVQADFAEQAADFAWLAEALNGSLLAVAAQDDSSGRIIGFARALGDGASDCYIQDVVVASEYRRQGIGRKLMEFMLKELAAKNIDWVGLIATPGKSEFYRQLGFEAMTDFTPMLLKNTTTK